jgi:hypothetical protein
MGVLDQMMKYTASLLLIHFKVKCFLAEQVQASSRCDENNVAYVKYVLSIQFMFVCFICTHLLEVSWGVDL